MFSFIAGSRNLVMVRAKTVPNFAAIALVAIPFLSQAQTQKPAFEVASVKPNGSGGLRVRMEIQPGGRFTATNVSLRMLITNAYQLFNYQIANGPDWVEKDRWDVAAKAAEGTIRTSAARSPGVPGDTQVLLQALIEDRYKLKAHKQTRNLPVYNLVVSKGGVKMKLSDNQTPPARPDNADFPQPYWGEAIPRGNVMMGPSNIHATGITAAELSRSLSLALGHQVVNRTMLKGLYDISLEWTPDIGQPMDIYDPTLPFPSYPNAPSIYTAIEERLGLRLVSAKGAVDVLVIDSVQKPTAN
jgi:uncharacterized protein (TIGR03435 family)